ncbi:MAG: transcription elongation factor GreA [Armatimonadetes bacterium]|nr:transcription elongation factor GreA [Armatimonadota bacterium]
MSDNTNDVIYLTPAGHKRLEEELQYLTTARRQEIAARIRDSKEHGEFSEDNSELDEVKFEQAMVEGRIVDLKSVLANAQVITPEDVSTKEVTIGSLVQLANTKSKDEFKVMVVSSIEADPDEDRISTESPLGEAIFGKKKGDKVTVEAPAGKITYEIKGLAKGVK